MVECEVEVEVAPEMEARPVIGTEVVPMGSGLVGEVADGMA